MKIEEETYISNEILYSKSRARETQTPTETKHNRQITQVEIPVKETCLTRKKRLILFIVGPVVAIGIIILIVLLTRPSVPPVPPVPPAKNNTLSNPKIETEFKFNNKIREPYYIYVEQKYEEEIMTNGIKTKQLVDSKIGYNIFFLNETESTEETKNLYDKVYTAVILISNQCRETKSSNCEPKKMIDLTKATRRTLRNLDEDIPDLKDIPLPLCLFKITDNDVILSMSCPESLPRKIRETMILDLYFFRPPAIKRPKKESNNVNITKTKKDDNELIIEKNRGICDVPDALESFCTTEMNTTTDKSGNVLFYDEIAYTNITHDENNFYIKNKITNLKDESEKLAGIDKDAYSEALNILIEKLKPYFKYYEEFSLDDFKKLYKMISKNCIKSLKILQMMMIQINQKELYIKMMKKI